MAKYKVTQWVTASVPIVSYVEANSEEEAEENLSNNIGAGDWKYRYDKIHYGELESIEAEEVVDEELDLPETGDTTTSDASPETEQVDELIRLKDLINFRK